MRIMDVSGAELRADAAAYLTRAISDLTGPTVLRLEPGEYFFSAAVEISGKNDLTIDGGGSVFVPFFDRTREAGASAEVFHFDRCERLTLRRFTIRASVPANAAGRVTAVNADSVDVEMQGAMPLGGKEMFIEGMTWNEAGVPTYRHWVQTPSDPSRRTIIAGEIPCTAPMRLDTPHIPLGGQRFRVFTSNPGGLVPGMRCSVSHAYYGLVACTFRNCERVLAEDISITNFGGFGFAILPRCRDFTFRRLRIASADPARQPFAVNSDGIHITGLGGKLKLEDCFFQSLGDDCLNVHTQVMTVKQEANHRFQLAFDKPGGIIAPTWARKGDCLRVYDPQTLRCKGRFHTRDFAADWIAFEEENAPIARGDFITNDAYYPDIEITGCTAKNFRSRAFVLQAVRSAVIQNCVFYGVSGPGVYLSTAFDKWLEAGPVENVTITGNYFFGCESWADHQAGAIWVRVVGERYRDIPPVHRNLVIRENTFIDLAGSAAVVTMTDGVTIASNTFLRGPSGIETIRVSKCAHAQVQDS